MKSCLKLVLLAIASGNTACSHVAAKPQDCPASDTMLITEHLTAITKTNIFRNYQNITALNQTADYILGVFKQYADTAYFQPYSVEGRIYKNVVCRFGDAHRPRIIMGAHYDVCGNQEGADDNASGVVGLLELARMLHGQALENPVELVAYSLEEPPFFRTEYMGSYIHVNTLKKANTAVLGMVALEMIGFFSDAKKSQTYPVKAMKVVYGCTGDYILLAKRSGYGKFVKQFSKKFEQAATIKTKSIATPGSILPIDFSDHLNYWNMGYDALMVTNTAFYRNKNYHQSGDTMETLDIPKMAQVIEATYQAITN